MRFINWIYDALISLDIIQANARFLILGLPGAGKYTFLRVFADNTLGILQPGLCPTSQELILNDIRYTTFDVGGQWQAQSLLEDYFSKVKVKAVIFVVDATDKERFAKARAELDVLLSLEKLSKVAFLVLGNKIDHHDAVSEDQLRDELGIYPLIRPIDRAIQLFMCSMAKMQGLEDAFRWLTEHRQRPSGRT
ncbi:ARF/SAR superfamily [Hypoxylon sp. NC0597]|nr:ARF/SAR superfamily [Hypoxylon sp. NC0597]